ncbi:MAG: galactan 5-O-arabinofuranosyltransferase, partial [Chloroflexota bacterium]|nr:galactan 5-O-arabinofuranosyltransferase [Chloroflexota bacterium]
MTPDPGVGLPGGRTGPSVRGSPGATSRRVGLGLLGLVVATILIDGGRGFLPAYPSGDLLYHWGLTHGILRGELPPGGPYQGLPAYYPPGFHLILAVLARLTGLSVPTVTWLLGFAWLPVLPLTTFALARWMTARSDIALVAAVLTVFGGAYDLGADRLWVNSLFLAGHQEYPLYPRDVVFGLLPLAILLFLRALDGGRRAWRWAVGSGILLGVCALIQVQLLLPIPIALVGVAAVTVGLDRERWRTALGTIVVAGGLTAVLVSPWLVPIVATIRRNGGIALDSADTLLPARFSMWDYPREFGLLLPLAALGIGVALLHLRAGNRERTGLAPRSPAALFVLVPWFVVPWLLAVLYDPGWPLEDALRPQRLWLLASQPGAILAAIGLFAAATRFAAIRLRRPRLQ